MKLGKKYRLALGTMVALLAGSILCFALIFWNTGNTNIEAYRGSIPREPIPRSFTFYKSQALFENQADLLATPFTLGGGLLLVVSAVIIHGSLSEKQ